MILKDPQILPVLDSIAPVVAQSRWVNFHPERIAPSVARWGDQLQAISSWQHPCHYFDGTQETVRWIFLLDVLNHCFWPDPGEPVWTVTYAGEAYSGYWGLAASLKRALENGIPLTDAGFLENISIGDLEGIFSGEGKIPLLHERLFNLREAGRVLKSRWNGDILNLIGTCEGSAVRVAGEIVSSFPSFRDEAGYEGKTVYFWKRAQIFASDLYHAFAGERWGCFKDIRELTAFADYKLPQVLRALGVLSYHLELAARIDRMELLDAGGKEEVEIRAMTVRAVEVFKDAFHNAGREVTSIEIDNWLWQLGQLEPFRQKPYHRCRTIFY